MAEEWRRKIADALLSVKADMEKGFAAFRVMLEDRTQRIQRLERRADEVVERIDAKIDELRAEQTVIDKKLAILETEVGYHRQEQDTAKLRIEKVEQAQIKADAISTTGAEERKARIQLWVAVIGGLFGLISSIVTLFINLLGG